MWKHHEGTRLRISRTDAKHLLGTTDWSFAAPSTSVAIPVRVDVVEKQKTKKVAVCLVIGFHPKCRAINVVEGGWRMEDGDPEPDRAMGLDQCSRDGLVSLYKLTQKKLHAKILKFAQTLSAW